MPTAIAVEPVPFDIRQDLCTFIINGPEHMGQRPRTKHPFQQFLRLFAGRKISVDMADLAAEKYQGFLVDIVIPEGEDLTAFIRRILEQVKKISC